LVIEEKIMRALTLFTATLAVVLGMSLGAQAATLTMSADKVSYAVSETITLTVIGDTLGGTDLGIFGTVAYNSALVSTGTHTQKALKTVNKVAWIRGGLNTDFPQPDTFDAFSQINGTTVAAGSTKKLTATMTFKADAAGAAAFDWWVGAAAQTLDFFGLVAATGTTVNIIPEPSTAGLMGLGLVGLVVAGRRRKS
jgi:hypothetical protein